MTLPLPEPPAVVPEIGPQEAGLAVASPAGPGPLLLDSEQATVLGTQRGRLDVRIADRVVARDLGADAGGAANVVAGPGSMRREWVGPNGVTLETVVVASRIPLVAVQWGPSGAPLPERISLRLPLAEGEVEHRSGPSSVAVAGGAGRTVAVGVSPPPLGIAVAPAESALEVEIRPTGGAPVTVLIAAGPPDVVRRAFSAAAHLRAHARLAREAPLDEGLVIGTGVRDIDEGVAWARWRLRGALARAGPSTDADAVVMAGLAGIGSGDRAAVDRARALLLPHAPLHAAVLAAGVSTTFGDAAPARDIAAALLDATLELEAAPAEPGLRRAALELLADALYRAAPEPLIEKLRRAAVPAAEPGPVRLPMASPSRAGQELGPWLRSLLRGEPTEPPGAELGGAAHLFRRDPDAAWAEWRASLAGGLEAGPAGPGTWDAADPRHGSVAPATSALLIGLAFGLLGMSPDAGVGRIRLAPRFPSHLLRFAVSGVPLGAAKLEMLYERDGGGHRFTLTPTRAAVPPTVVFEPGVPGGVRAVRIDGEAAELECREERGRTVVPAQLSLDGARSVEVLSGEGSQSVSTTM